MRSSSRVLTTVSIAIATITVGAQSSRAPAQSSMRNERGFATQLQLALRTGDRQTVARLVRYPARVSVLQRPYPIYVRDRDALDQMYDLVFTPTRVAPLWKVASPLRANLDPSTHCFWLKALCRSLMVA